MVYTFKAGVKAEELDAFVEKHPFCSLMQSSKWAKVKDEWNSKILGVKIDGELQAAALVLIKRLPMGMCMMYIPRGPVMDYSSKKLARFFIGRIRQWAKDNRCLFIKLDPGIVYREFFLEDDERTVKKEAEEAIETLKSAGCVHLGFTTDMDDTIQPRFHAAVKQCENYMDTLPKHTKRHVKTAQKKHISVEAYGPEKLPEFARLMKLTEERKQIYLRTEEYFQRLMDIFGEQAKLFLAKIDIAKLLEDSRKRVEKLDKDIAKCKEGQEGKRKTFTQERDTLIQDMENLEAYRREDGDSPYIAGALCVYFGDTCEMLYMGMDGKYQKFHGAFLSHIGPIQYAQEQGIRWCNMGGLEGTLDGGLTQFKSNFHPTIREYIGEFDIIIRPRLYKIATAVMKWRKQRLVKKDGETPHEHV